MKNDNNLANSEDVLSESECLAHVIYETGRKQFLEEHLKNVAEFAEKICPLPELKVISYLCGILHDIGKAGAENQDDFQAILKYGEGAHKHNLDHSTAGGYIVYDMAITGRIAELVSIVVYSHHGIQDCIELNTGRTLEERRREKRIDYDLIRQRFLQLFDEKILEEKFKIADRDFVYINNKIGAFLKENQLHNRHYGDGHFFMGMYVRLLLSVLIDSDWIDTSCFSQGKPLPERISVNDTQKIWKDSIYYFENCFLTKVQKDPSNGNLLSECRQQISDLCMKAAQEENKLYRLTVPTGAGKTLSSLRFALHHALEKNKHHIIYIAPFNSILEQNAQEIRNAVGNSEIVLEHHCNVVCEDERQERKYRELTETWDSPIIVTTAVQILNTLFSDRKICIRRMHTLCNSIIIFDEVQAFPVKCRELFYLAVNFLTVFCNTTVVLCSATQPSLASLEKNNICRCTEMAGKADGYSEIFKRTQIVDETELYPGGMEIPDLKNFVLENVELHQSVLVIVNTTTCARNLFISLKEECGEYEIFHLSNNMCAENKLDKLTEIKDMLKIVKNGKKVICVSTQVVEAGVNFSFGCVIRSKAGLDNIIQAAGRCNRHKELKGTGAVYIIQMSREAENLNHLPEIITAQKALQKVLDDFKKVPERFGGSLDSQEAIKAYYENYYYGLDSYETKFPVSKYNTTLVDLLGKDSVGCKQYERLHNTKKIKSPFVQAFQTAGREFEVISDEYKTNIVVPYNEDAKRSIQKLQNNYLKPDEQRKEIRTLQRYTVGISEWRKDKLSNVIYGICDNEILVLSEGYYDNEVGVLDKPKMDTLMI